MSGSRGPVSDLLDRYRPLDQAEAADVERVRSLADNVDDPWLRSIPLHITGSALIVHPDTGRVLLRWHQRQKAWLQVGGHADPGETEPLAVALREAAEETGLTDLEPWPDARLRHVVIVPVPASDREPAHEHADLRFVLATRTPDAARAENPDAPLRWLSPDEAREISSEANLQETVSRAERLLAGDASPASHPAPLAHSRGGASASAQGRLEDLAGGFLRKLGHEPDLARALVGSQALAAIGHDVASETDSRVVSAAWL
jgi:8-oxo-dGTP pyrophosphatase MutT (NUDIX family)